MTAFGRKDLRATIHTERARVEAAVGGDGEERGGGPPDAQVVATASAAPKYLQPLIRRPWGELGQYRKLRAAATRKRPCSSLQASG